MGGIIMKKIVSIVSAAAICLSLVGCSTGVKDPTSDLSSSTPNYIDVSAYYTADDPCTELRLANNYEKMEVDRIMYSDLEEIENASRLIIVGRVTGNARQEIFNDGSLGINVITNIVTYSEVEITEVFKGDVNVGDLIEIYASYGIIEDRLTIEDGIAPLIEGDEWIFFLKRDPIDGTYFQSGGFDGRYPTKNSNNSRNFSLLEHPELGVVNEKDFNWKIYNELVEKYDI